MSIIVHILSIFLQPYYTCVMGIWQAIYEAASLAHAGTDLVVTFATLLFMSLSFYYLTRVGKVPLQTLSEKVCFVFVCVWFCLWGVVTHILLYCYLNRISLLFNMHEQRYKTSWSAVIVQHSFVEFRCRCLFTLTNITQLLYPFVSILSCL